MVLTTDDGVELGEFAAVKDCGFDLKPLARWVGEDELIFWRHCDLMPQTTFDNCC